MSKQIIYNEHDITELIELLHKELFVAKYVYEKLLYCRDHRLVLNVFKLLEVINKQERLAISIEKTVAAVEYYRDNMNAANTCASSDIEMFELQTLRHCREI